MFSYVLEEIKITDLSSVDGVSYFGSTFQCYIDNEVCNLNSIEQINRLTNGEGTSKRGGLGSPYGRLTKFEFPKFSGDDVQGWLYIVNRFFLLDSILDNQKVRLVSMHMFDKALNWHKQFVKKYGENVEWTVYEREVQKRFDSVFKDPMVELKNLKQITTVQLYQEQFEALMNKVELSEAYAVSLFIEGLKDDISINVTYPPKSTTTTLALPVPTTAKPTYVQPRKQLTQKEIADKRAKNLCFYYDEKFVLGHKCSGQLFSLEICADSSNSKEYKLEALLEEPLVQNFGNSMPETPVISLHALLNGESTYEGHMGLKPMLESIQFIHSLILIMRSLYECKGFTWTLQGVEFTSDVLILLLGGCEMVLGVQWLSILGDIKWNFKDLVMDFVYNKRRMVLRGTQKATLQWMSGKSCWNPTMKFLLFLTHFHLKELKTTKFPYSQTLLQSISDHTNTPSQKDAVEAMVKELMESGYTVKDKFPILVVEELLDELSGAQFFSKLDLRSGYHQIRMHEEDIGKTTFRTHEGHYEFLVMPFGLTNAPSTFQALMNTIFKPFLRHFTLVFFDDILVYSSTLKEHLQHLQLVLQTMKQNSLYAKMNKYIFATTQVEYLGHIISGKGVSTDPSKIITMQKWPTPVNVKQLRGFLGLTGYYRRFIKDYASISKPLTLLLKKNSFVWNPNAQTSFGTLKEAMSQAPVLALPNFNKSFTVEIDASGMGIGAVLQQGGHPIAYLSKSLSSKHQALSAYEKEFYAVLMALEKWRRYLLDKHFKIKTDHFSLKYLLDQRLTTHFQAKWLPKLLGYDYEISYKKGSENYVVDALYMISNGSELCYLVLSTVSSDLLQQIKSSWEKDVDLQLLIQQIANHTYTGVQVTLNKLGIVLYWRGMKKFTKKFVSECNVCQRNKPDLSASPGYLQPLPIPTKVWHDISMDFIEALPPSQGKIVLFVVVDRLSKYAHFIPVSHPFTTSQVAQAFMDHVYKLHDHVTFLNVVVVSVVLAMMFSGDGSINCGRSHCLSWVSRYAPILDVMTNLSELALLNLFVVTSKQHQEAFNPNRVDQPYKGQENVIVVGADNRSHMLDKTNYSSWVSRMLLYIKGKEHGKLLVDSVLKGPFQYGTVVEPRNETTPATVRARTYTDLTDEEKIRESVDIKATNIVL
ncbi:putative mitochondrial protein [Tanacetum coccineum]|uniref:Mitochondrial protein n=1 Tax=Tanacetum coccineum TaxID=301880 RepID=A0ABQ4XJ38_9ASTR